MLPVKRLSVCCRFFTWRFPSLIYNEAFDLMTGLYKGGSSDRPNNFHFQKDPENPGEEGDARQEEDEDDAQAMLQFPMDAPGGASACCLTLMTLGLLSVDISIPQQIVVVDTTMVDNEVVKRCCSHSRTLADTLAEDLFTL